VSFSLSTFLFQVANFLVLLFILRRFVYVPLYRMIDARRAAIASAQEQAERAREEATVLQAQAQTERDAIERERALMIEDARKAIAAERERAEAAALESADAQRVALERDLADARRRATEELGEELSTMAIGVVERLLRQIADVTLHEQLCRHLAEALESGTKQDRPGWSVLHGREEPVLEAAKAVEPAMLQRLAEAVDAHIGRSAQIVVRIDPGLLAGARLRLGGRIWDSSLAGWLTAIRNEPGEDIALGIPTTGTPPEPPRTSGQG
jgi:F-type H+-transporting ATPase subunit b